MKNKALSWILGGILSLYAVGSDVAYSKSYNQEDPRRTRIETVQEHNSIDSKIEKELPHFLRDVTIPQNEYDKMILADRIILSARGDYLGSRAAPITVNESITFDETIHGEPIKFVLTEYSIEKDLNGKDYLWFHTKNGRHKMNLNELKPIKKYLVNKVKESAEKAFSYQKDWTKKIINIQEKQLKEKGFLKKNEKLEDILNKKVEGYKHLTYANALKIPIIKEPKDFLPKTLLFGPFDAWGACFIDADIVMYHPIACKLDYINREPTTLIHEFTHNNEKLQNLPYTDVYDVELFTTFPMLMHEDLKFYVSHPYVKDMRHVAKVLFGFDAKKAKNECFGISLLNMQIYDKEKIMKYIEDKNVVSEVMQKIALDEFAPEFYSHFNYYITINDDLQDDSGAFKVFMYSKFQPTLLNGSRETKQWLEEHDLILDEIARKTEASLSKRKSDSNTDSISKDEIEMLRNIAKHYNLKNDHKLEDLKEIIKTLDEVGLINLRGR